MGEGTGNSVFNVVRDLDSVHVINYFQFCPGGVPGVSV